MVHGYGLDLSGARMQRVDEPDVAVAAQSKNVGHFLPDEVVDDNASAGTRGLARGVH